MQARKVVGSALLAAGMMMAGYGGATAEAAEPGALMSEAAQPDRSEQDYEYTYYREPAKWNVIGGQGRSAGVWFRWGSTSSYYDYTSDTGF